MLACYCREYYETLSRKELDGLASPLVEQFLLCLLRSFFDCAIDLVLIHNFSLALVTAATATATRSKSAFESAELTKHSSM
jgi:hypothetical protein